ncbi:DUF3293 domain-containing protein [Actinomycetospora sp. CA-084318]|uniref:DUF3293 domain-containing protein n=1 Tax=Actinomycetospora sp. CA-084318 TaxID=3239892 RepID=UPI003D98EF43
MTELRPCEQGTGYFPYDGPVHVLTAYNPGPEVLDVVENERSQAALIGELPSDVQQWRAEAGSIDGSHTEVSVAVRGLSDEAALQIARRYGQDAIFRWTAEAWSILPCDGGAPLHHGWRTRSVPSGLPNGMVLRRVTGRPDGSEAVLDRPTLDETTLVLEPGTSTTFLIDEFVASPAELTAKVQVVGNEPDNPDDWDDEFAEHIETFDEEFPGPDWVHRYFGVNGHPGSVARVGEHLVPVLDEDGIQLAEVEVIASHSWDSDGGGRPMSTDGGNSLGRIRPGVLYARQWGDFGAEHELLPDNGAESLAAWVERCDLAIDVALATEETDAETRERIDGWELDLLFPNDDLGRRARALLAERNEHYRRTRDALQDPGGADGQRLRAMVSAVEEGEDLPESVTYGMWL